jgi:hypothetical protein
MQNQHNISHSEMVAKLIKSGEVLKNEWVVRDFQLIHATIGIVGECGELLGGIDFAITNGGQLDRANLVEEFGDLEFYMENFRSILSISRFDVTTCETVCWIPPTVARIAAHILVYSTELLDQVKKTVIYRKEINRVAVIANLSKIEFLLEALRGKLEITREEALKANMDKLAIRYEGFQYSNQQAQDRADKIEEKIVGDVLNAHDRREEDGSN